MAQDTEIIRGDDTILNFAFTDENDAIVDISSANLTFTAKSDFDGTAVISKTVASGEHTTPTSGVTEFLLTHDESNVDTGTYYWDVQLTFGNGIVNSVRYGRLVILNDIS